MMLNSHSLLNALAKGVEEKNTFGKIKLVSIRPEYPFRHGRRGREVGVLS